MFSCTLETMVLEIICNWSPSFHVTFAKTCLLLNPIFFSCLHLCNLLLKLSDTLRLTFLSYPSINPPNLAAFCHVVRFWVANAHWACSFYTFNQVLQNNNWSQSFQTDTPQHFETDIPLQSPSIVLPFLPFLEDSSLLQVPWNKPMVETLLPPNPFSEDLFPFQKNWSSSSGIHRSQTFSILYWLCWSGN